MFPSVGFFTRINCYLFERGLCTRPHCVFKHDAEVQDRSDTLDKCTLDLTETEEATDECLQELERINREIENVKHQVEEEQRRLSNYKIKSCNNSEVISKSVVQTSPLVTSNQQKNKYTVDCSKPRTDLEYDPLSNFSSDLRSYDSTKREHKKRNARGSERKQSICDEMSNVMVQGPEKHPEKDPDSSEDDDILSIDLPPSPTKPEETKPNGDGLANVSVCNLTGTNANSHNEIITKSCVTLTVSQSNSDGNKLILTDNIFVKMTQHLSNYDNLNVTQACDIQNNVTFDKNCDNACPESKMQTNQAQKPEFPGQTAGALRQMKRPQLRSVGMCNPDDILAATKQAQDAILQQMHPKKTNVIVIDSSSDELNYSDVEMSESDPEEECYRIFMEENGEEKANKPMQEINNAEKNVLQPQISSRKRVAHEAKTPGVVRPQPSVLVPLFTPVSTFRSQPPAPVIIVNNEQKASKATASIEAGQAVAAKGPFGAKHTPSTSCSISPKPAPCISYIPLEATVIDVGNNLHLVLPEGTFPMSDTSGQVSSVLTPIIPVKSNPIPMKRAPQRYTTQPLIIPPQAQRPFSAAAANPCSTVQAAAVKPVGIKRKLKQQCETVKVPHDVRQTYVNKFTEEFLKTTANINEAFEKALAEERTVYNRSANRLKYLSVAVNALKRLRSQNCDALKEKDHQTSEKTKGNIPLNLKLLKGEGVTLLYECFKDYVLTEEMLIEGNFPLQNPEKPGSVILYADKKSSTDPLRKLCCRCGATYSVSRTGKHSRKEECIYHYGRGIENKVPGGVETRYSCCEGVMGSPGCQIFKLHVTNSLIMDGFVTTAPREPTDTNCPGVYALDCEKCYTICGLELSRVTVVNSCLQIVYDTFVRPSNEVIDYNTRFSGISEEDMKRHCHSLKEVQMNLLSFINADTILIGHGMETNLCVLKLIHGMVVDTSAVFPHRLGPPHKISLHSLTAEYLRKIIQESVCGHDTAEDAIACMELMLWKAKEDGKLRKTL